MRLPIEVFNRIRSRVPVSDIVSGKVALKRAGKEYSGLCPFHHEKSPSFTVNDGKGFYHCFGCGAHGDVIKFFSETKGVSYAEAAKSLADSYNIEIPKLSHFEQKKYEKYDEIYNLLERTKNFYIKGLEKSPEAQKYLSDRNMMGSPAEKFLIGYAPRGLLLKYLQKENLINLAQDAGLIGKREDGSYYEILRDRIIFPIVNVFGKVIAFGGRALGDAKPKYINSPETIIFNKSETLYGENFAVPAAYRSGKLILVEGYTDVIALNSAGITDTVATLGTSVTLSHLDRMWRTCDEIIACFDGDAAGFKAMERLIERVLPVIKSGNRLSVIILPKGNDPWDVINRLGREAFDKYIEQRKSLADAIWELKTRGKNLNDPETLSSVEQDLKQTAFIIEDKTLAGHIWSYFKEKLWQSKAQKFKKNKLERTSYLNQMAAVATTQELELERKILGIILLKPEILLSEDICETLVKIRFSEEMHGFFDYVISFVHENEELDPEQLQKKLIDNVKNSGFIATYNILYSDVQNYLKVNLLRENSLDSGLVLRLINKFMLHLMQKECEMLLKKNSDESYQKALIYRDEIKKLRENLQ